jgi:membrane-associated protein
MSELFEFLRHLINPEWILTHGGLWLLLLIVFAETGLFVGFFLPGDSLLFVTGMVLSRTHDISGLSLIPIMLLVSACGIAGNYAGYWFGKKSGPLLFNKKDTFFFKQRYLHAAKKFYDKHGGMAIVFARFLPFIRTFAPIVAGIVLMDYRKFSFFNLIGCVAWVFSMILSGYFLGRAFPALAKHLDLIVIGIILLSVIPVIITYLRNRVKSGALEKDLSEKN